MKVYARRPNYKKGHKLPVITVRQPKATGVLHQNDNKIIIINVQTHNIDIGRKLQLFPTPNLHLTPSLGVFPLEFQEKVWSSEN